jgi:predicted Zn-dependent protease
MSPLIERHRQAVARSPESELARFSLGKALFDDGQFAAAREQSQFALARKPDWMVVQILIGKCDLALGDRAAARAAFERARQLALDQDHDGPRAEMEQLLAEL